MEFCPKCGSIIIVTERGSFACAKCGYRPKGRVKIESSEKIAKTATVFVIKEKELEVNPVVEMKCPKCKHDKAYFWTLQTRSSDESETKFYKCTKCEHTWRKYR